MYSGTTFRNHSGRLIGAHQKLDRAARKALEQLKPDSTFPKTRDILHFEGKNGPDGIKRKSPARDEPWHYYDPTDPKDTELVQMIQRHSKNLTAAIKKGSTEKAAFEAAWLAHAVVDGLTPAHHFPLERKLEEMRGEGLETRTSIRDKLIVKSEGDTRRQMLAKNWQFWGAKGIMTSHLLFEIGIATTIAPMRLKKGYPTAEDCLRVEKEGAVALFKEAAREIYELKMYERFTRKGWTRRLARETREVLAPAIVRIVALAWYEALVRAEKTK
ncbi:MAG: hypothetical protein ACREGJ_02140 [Candidatus Saccharimonadales bacterium]